MENKVHYNQSSHIFQSEIKNGVFNPYTDTIIYDGGLVIEQEGEKEQVIIYDGGNVIDRVEEQGEEE